MVNRMEPRILLKRKIDYKGKLITRHFMQAFSMSATVHLRNKMNFNKNSKRLETLLLREKLSSIRYIAFESFYLFILLNG